MHYSSMHNCAVVGQRFAGTGPNSVLYTIVILLIYYYSYTINIQLIIFILIILRTMNDFTICYLSYRPDGNCN